MAKKMPPQFEKRDKAADKKAGVKENSRADQKTDAKGMTGYTPPKPRKGKR